MDGGGQPYPASRDATTPFFFLAFAPPDPPTGVPASGIGYGFYQVYPKASKGEKVGGGHAGTPKVRLPPSYRTMPPEVRY